MNPHPLGGQAILHQLLTIGSIIQHCKQWDHHRTLNRDFCRFPPGILEFLPLHNITNTIPIKKLWIIIARLESTPCQAMRPHHGILWSSHQSMKISEAQSPLRMNEFISHDTPKWLVVEPPLWKIWKSIEMMTFPICGTNVRNHHPANCTKTQWPWRKGTDEDWKYLPYVFGLCEGRSPQDMARHMVHGRTNPLWDLEIPIEHPIEIHRMNKIKEDPIKFPCKSIDLHSLTHLLFCFFFHIVSNISHMTSLGYGSKTWQRMNPDIGGWWSS